MREPDTNASPFAIDKQQIRRSFDRAAGAYDTHAALQREVGDRLIARLDLMRLDPAVIADVGAGTGYCSRALERRYRKARVLLVDIASSMLQVARSRRRRFGSHQSYLCADAENLAIESASIDLVFSNLSLQWCSNPLRVFTECRRVLKPHGLFLFSTLGPDTLKELRAAWAAVDKQPRVNAFIDMHDLGDALIEAGFSGPVLDRDNLVLTYDDAFGVMRDLKGIGAQNHHQQRARGMLGRSALRRMVSAYETFRCDGLLPATYEVVYGHAWIPSITTRPQDGSTVATFPLQRIDRR